MFAIHAFILVLIACALGILFASRERGLGRLRDVVDILPLVKPNGLKKGVIPPTDPRFPRVQGHLLVSTLKTLGGMSLRAVTLLLVGKHFGWQDQLLNETAIVYLVMTFMGYWHSANTALFMVRARKANPADPREARLIEVYNEVLRDARKLERKDLIAKYESSPKYAQKLALLKALGDDVPQTPWLLKRLRNVRDGINFVFDKLMPKAPEFQRRAIAGFIIAIAGLNRLNEDPELYFFDGDSNAFASGPLPFMSVIAVSSDLLQQWQPSEQDVIDHLNEFPEERMTRRMMKAVLSHERGHVARLDIMVNALMNLETVALSLLVDTPIRLVTGFVRTKWVEVLLSKLRLPDAAKALGLDWIMRAVGQVIQMAVSQVQKIIPAFVTRSRESGSDGYAALITERPLDLAYGLKALRPFVMWRREQKEALRRSFLGAKFAKTYEEHRMETALLALRPIMFIDFLNDTRSAQEDAPAPQPRTGNAFLDFIIKIVTAFKAGLARIRRAWDSLFYTHPSIETRIRSCCVMEFGNTGFCPVFTEPNPDQEF